MKKYLFIALAALVALAACKKDPVVEEFANKNDGAVLTFTSKKPQLTPETKTAWNAESRSIVWTAGDKISVGYTLNGAWMAQSTAADLNADPKVSPKFYVSTQVSIDGEDAGLGTFKVPSSFAFSNAGTAVFYGVYPSSALGSNVDHAPSLTISVPTGQAPGENTFDPSADIMVGKSGEVTLTDALPTDPIELDWTRIVAHADLTFSGLADVEGETVSEITLAFDEDAKVAGSFYVDVTSGSVTTNTGSKNEIVLSGSNLAISEHDIKAWACLMPVTFTALDVTIETNKAVYTKSISDINKTFIKNARNTLTINMAEAARTVKTAAPRLFQDGNYIITISSTQGGDKMMAAASSSPQKAVATATEIQNGKYQAEKDAVWTITYNTADGTYSFYSLSKELYLSGASTATDLSLNSTPTYFTATEVSEGVYTFSVKGSGSTRYISYNYNNGSDRFALYTTNQDYIKNIAILPAEAIAEQEIIETPKAGTDVLNLSFTAISGTSYAEWGPTQGSATNAYYIGQSGGQNSAIQLRSSNNNSGIVVWKSSGYVKSVTVSWNSSTSNGRTLDIYGKHTAYDAATDLYASDATKQGTKVGSIVKGTSTTYTFTDNYEYIGLRSSSGAMYLTSISIEWGTEPFAAKVATPVITFDSSTNQVSISCDTDGAAIYYTTNNTEPTSSSTLYTAPIQLSSGDAFTVKAIAVKSGMDNSEIASKNVTFHNPSTGNTLTVSDSDFPEAYPTSASTITVDNVSLAILNVANYGNGIQFKKSGGYVQNTTSLGTITRISFVAQEGKTNSGLTVYAGTSASDISIAITRSDGEFDFTGGNYSFFKIINNSSSAQYLSSFVVEYE